MRSTLRTSAAIAPIVMLLSFVQPAAAQPDPSAEADAYFRKGKEAAKAGKLGEALDAYRAAWARKKSSDIACNLGNVEQRSGRARDAAEHLAYCLRTFPATGSAEQRTAAQKAFDEAKAQVGTLAIQTSVAGAEILVDGASAGRSPLEDPLFVEAGSHRIDAKLAGYDDAHQDVAAEKGATKNVALTLVAAKGAVGAGAAGAGAADGAGAAGGAGGAGAAGANGGAGGAEPEPSKKSVPILIAGFGVAAVGLGVGIGFTVASNGARSDADALKLPGGDSACTAKPQPAQCAELASKNDDVGTLAGGAVAGYVIGGLALAGTLTYLLWPTSGGAKATAGRRSVRAAPSVSPGFVGGSVAGSF